MGTRTERNASGNILVHEFEAMTTDGVMAVVGRITPKQVVDAKDSTKISPNSVKIDIRVQNFPYKQNSSKLCMVGKLKTKMEVEAEIDDDDDRRRLLGGRALEGRHLGKKDDEDD